MKRPKNNIHADTMSHSKVIRSKKCQNLSLGQNFLLQSFFVVINISLKLQQHILICFCKFRCNSEIL